MKQFDKNIIYEDNHLLVVDKPVHVLTQADASGRKDLETMWRHQYSFVHALHRVDYVASGIVILAKSSKALSRMNQAFKEKKVLRGYIACVALGSIAAQGQWVDDVSRSFEGMKVVSHKDSKSKTCILDFKLIETLPYCHLLAIKLQTGRHHQIRVQCALRNMPILGDTRYGSTQPWEGIALHHSYFKCIHPVTLEPLCFYKLPNWPRLNHKLHLASSEDLFPSI